MGAVVVCGSYVGERPSRRIERGLAEDGAFQILAGTPSSITPPSPASAYPSGCPAVSVSRTNSPGQTRGCAKPHREWRLRPPVSRYRHLLAPRSVYLSMRGDPLDAAAAACSSPRGRTSAHRCHSRDFSARPSGRTIWSPGLRRRSGRGSPVRAERRRGLPWMWMPYEAGGGRGNTAARGTEESV